MFVAGRATTPALPFASVLRSATGAQPIPSIELWSCTGRPPTPSGPGDSSPAASGTSWPQVMVVPDVASVSDGASGATEKGGALAGARPAALATSTAPGAAPLS